MNINTAENIILSHFHSWQQLCPAWSRSMLTRVIFTFLVTATCSIFFLRKTHNTDRPYTTSCSSSFAFICLLWQKVSWFGGCGFHQRTDAVTEATTPPSRPNSFSYPDISSNSRQTDKGHKNTGTVQTKLNCCWCCRFPKTSIITSRNIYLPMLVIVDELFPFPNQAPSSVVHSYGPLRLFSVMA